MKIGITIPNNWGVHDANDLVDLACHAEDAGLDSLWTSEHLINTSYVQVRIGDRPYYHPLATLSYLAAKTSRIQLGTSVLVVPFHNPFDLAKYAATLDHLSRGRLVLGVGVGQIPEEFEALSIPWNKRGAITDETLDIMKLLWREESASYRGSFWNFTDARTSPKPYRDRELPIWVGGMSDAAMRRAARIGDGWHPTAVTPDQFRAGADTVREMAQSYGHDPAKLDFCMRYNIALDDTITNEIEQRATLAADDHTTIVRTAERYAEAGVTQFFYALNSRDKDVLRRTVDQLARDVLPRFK